MKSLRNLGLTMRRFNTNKSVGYAKTYSDEKTNCFCAKKNIGKWSE